MGDEPVTTKAEEELIAKLNNRTIAMSCIAIVISVTAMIINWWR